MPRHAITTLLEERAGLFDQMRALSDAAEAEGRDLTAEEYTQYQTIESQFDTLTARTERMQREEGIETNLDRRTALPEADPVAPGVENDDPVATTRAGVLWNRLTRRAGGDEALEELRTLANRGVEQLRSRARQGDSEARMLYFASDEYRDAWIAHARARGVVGELSDEQRAALNVGTGAQGGYTVPVEFYRQLVISERFFGVMRQLATTIVTAGNGPLQIPKVDDANRMTAGWVAEAGAFTESEDQFLQATLGAFKAGTIAKLSDELILDSAFDILGFVAQSAGQALALLTNTAYVVGANGSATTPEGLFTKATVGFTLAVGNTTSITPDSIFELYHSVRPPYRVNGVWMFNDQTIKSIRQLKDSQNRYLWEPALTAGDPDRLVGRPVYADPDVPVMAASALSGGFGDVARAYWIRDVQDITVKILNELYAANGQVGFRVHRRTDGDLIDTVAFKTLKNSAT